VTLDATDCSKCQRDSCPGDCERRNPIAFDLSALVSADTLIKEGRAILEAGVPYVVDGMIPAYGMVGFLVAGSKVGKTTTGLRLLSSISRGEEFLGLQVQRRKVLMLALEDPREYLAVLVAGAFKGGEDAHFYPRSLVLDEATLAALSAYVTAGGFELVYVATFLNAVRGLVKDENDNAGMVQVVNSIKQFARGIKVPTLIEAHAGKGEDLSDEADPVKALRGASAAAAEADYLLSLKRKGGGFSTLRTLSGLGRFVSFAPITFDYARATGDLVLIDSGDTTAAAETDWRLILEAGALSDTPQGAASIAVAAGWCETPREVTKPIRQRVDRALRRRDGVAVHSSGSGRASRTKYSLAVSEMREVA